MAVATNERKAHVVGSPISFVDFSSNSHCAGRADGAEPIDVIFDDEESAGNDQPCEEVVVMGERGSLADVGIEQS